MGLIATSATLHSFNADGVEGLNLDSQLPALETILASPVVKWRAEVALVLASTMSDDEVEGAMFDSERFLELCDIAMTSPDSANAHLSALLLAGYWSDFGTEGSKRMTNQYLDFASQSEDDNLLAQVETLRQSIQAS